MTSGAGEPPVLENCRKEIQTRISASTTKCITFASRNELEKLKSKIEWTKQLTAQAKRLGNQWTLLTDPNFDLSFTRRSRPATPRSGLCASRKGLRRQGGRLQELRLLLNGRAVQLYQHNP